MQGIVLCETSGATNLHLWFQCTRGVQPLQEVGQDFDYQHNRSCAVFGVQ